MPQAASAPECEFAQVVGWRLGLALSISREGAELTAGHCSFPRVALTGLLPVPLLVGCHTERPLCSSRLHRASFPPASALR